MALTILAIDTSTEACSVALFHHGEIIGDFVLSAREHTKQVLPMVDYILAEADCHLTQLDAIAFSRGPGSFTGVRIGVGVAQGLAFGADKPLIPISTLETLAQGALRLAGAKQVIVTIDARMNEVYCGQYLYNKMGRWDIQTKEQVISPKEVGNKIKNVTETPLFNAGSGFRKYPDLVPESISSGILLPNAKDMLPLAESLWHSRDLIYAEDAEPVYLRNEVIRKKS